MLRNNLATFLTLHIKFFTYVGLWKTEKTSKFYDVYQVCLVCLQYSVVLFIFIYLGIVWGDLNAMSMGLYVLFSQASTCLKVTTMIIKRKEMIKLLECLNLDIFVAQTLEQQAILSMQCLKMRKLFIFLVASVTVNCIEWSVVPLLSNQGPRTFPFTMWMPGNINKSPDYELGYLYQMAFAFFGGMSFMAIDSLAITLISFGCAQLDIIRNKIQKIQKVPYAIGTNNEDRNDIVKENNMLLSQCLRHHQAVIGFIASVEKFFNVTIFFQLSGSVAIVCIIAFRLSVEKSRIQFYCAVNYMISMLAQLYFYCWSGNELTSRSQELRDELYQCPWYDQDVAFRRKMLVAMECMKKPIVFKAGYYITLTRPTFVAILRCSYSYFAVLNQANNE